MPKLITKRGKSTMEDVGSLGWLIRQWRQDRGLSQRELAGRAGLSLGAIRDLEQDRSSRPHARSSEALADALELSRADRGRLRQLAIRRQPEPPARSGPVRISVLGPLAVESPSGPIDVGSGRHRVVLARLAMTPHHPVSREELIEVLWPEGPPRSAANVLQTHVSRLRRILEPRPCDGAAALVWTPGGYQLRMDENGLDVVDYRNQLAEWRRSSSNPQRAFDLLQSTLDLWRGHRAAEDIVELQEHHLVTAFTDELIESTIQLALLGLAVQRLPEVLPRLRRLAARHLWHEPLHARLVVTLAALGQQAAALDAYEEIKRRLAEELAIEPGAALVAARQAVLAGRWDQRPRAREERLPIPWEAPAPPADFIGRAEQLHSLQRLFRSALRNAGTARQVTCVLSGMPGVGKTSLALRAAESLRDDFPDGQLYIDLRGAERKPASVLTVLARLLRGLGTPGHAVPIEVDEACALYRTLLAERQVLVILDNARNTDQLRMLLPGSGGSAVLITSRQQCADLPGAVHIHLPVLPLTEAVDMLGGRSRSAWTAADRKAATALAEACGRLPVALRVIASRLAGRPRRTPAELLRSLADGRPPAGNAADAAIDLSYRELRPEAARLFRSAAQLPGTTFSREAAAALFATDADATGRTLDGLVAENMLEMAGTDRYRYHDLLRRYALEVGTVYDDGSESAALRRVADWYLTRTAAAIRLVYPAMVRLPTEVDATAMCFPDVSTATAWLDEEIGNLVALIETLAGDVHRARAWQLADQLRGYFFVCRDAISWLATGTAGMMAAEAADDRMAQAAMYQTIGQAHWSLGRHRTALEAYRSGVAAARDSGWLIGEAYLMHNLGLVHAELGMMDDAHQLYQHVLRVGGGSEFAHVRAVTLNDLGVMYTEQGRLRDAVGHFRAAMDINSEEARLPSAMVNCHNLGMALRHLEEFDAAHEHLTRVLAYFEEANNKSGQMSTLDELSQLYQQRAEWSAGVDAAEQALRIAEHLANRRAIAGGLNTLGSALLGARAVTEAQARFREALELSREHGFQYFAAQSGIGLANVLLRLGAIEKARDAAAEALEITRRKDYRVLAGDALTTLARTGLAAGDPHAAADHCDAALGYYRSAGIPGRLRDLDLLTREIAVASQHDGRSVAR
ncbi:tetratricopeptide repeat protein [Actinoplanes sp. KI2]|uniref:tetratricopeptide repeat protein n=1 Tax=Actinoplanes sp. KI2 TaxID=2983315 RepID=UPI0021D5BA9F|nr:tetratricopeptide repeat protein [Actinoplanes sp. KI2]MCU7724004.1 tetratricopeptide repeat protein [Actinoplanes sp. KI2]